MFAERETWGTILDQMREIEGEEDAVILSSTGQSMAACAGGLNQFKAISEAWLPRIQVAGHVLEKTSCGHLEEMQLEKGDQKTVLIRDPGKDLWLAVVGRSQLNPGLVRLKLERMENGTL